MTRPWRLRRRLVVAATAAIVGALAGVAPVIAQPRDNASRSDVLRIAIVFVAGAPQDGELAREVARVITANLERSGRFTPIDPAAFTEKITGFDAVPRFDDLRAADVQCLVTGRIAHQPDDRLRAEFRLWDVTGGVQLMGQQYFTSTDHARLIGHIMSDAIYERLTGRKGEFESGSR